MSATLAPEAFRRRLHEVAALGYHDHHPFHVAMHEGRLTAGQLRAWVANRYYYQTRIPVKDALILAKAEDPGFRRGWRRRLVEHDGDAEGHGGLARWERLGLAVGLEVAGLRSHASVLPGVRSACDGYVELVREASLVEAVAASLTELHAPALMERRILAWLRHYPWVGEDALAYFRGRVTTARDDAEEGITFVMAHARSADVQLRCERALMRKTEILWSLLDAISAAHPAGACTR